MLEAVIADIDPTAGIRPTMPWQQQVRRALQNSVDLLTARPVALPLQIAYQGPLTPGIAALMRKRGFPVPAATAAGGTP